MSNRYVLVRMRRSDFDKIMQTKKKPIEQDLQKIVGKKINIKNIDMFTIAANSVWDLGSNYQGKIIRAVKIKKPNFKI